MTDDGGVAVSEVRALLAAGLTIVGDLGVDLDLGQVLRSIVESAVQLAPADRGILAVAAEDGSLGEYVRVDAAEGDPRDGPDGDRRRISVGVPVRVRGEAFGNLSVTRGATEPFTRQDEELLEVLAATAGVAIANARLYEESGRRQEWLAASTEVTRRVLAGDEGTLRLVARRVRELADSDLTTVVLPVETELLVAVAEGHAARRVEGVRYAASGTLSEHVLRHGKPMRLADAANPANVEGTFYLADEVTVGPIMVLPLLGREDVRGTLVVMRGPDRQPFTEADAEMATTFANHASVALELAEARRDQQRVLLLEDRARIARDLHDHVIQQVFAAGLVIQATASRLRDPSAVTALQEVVGNLDDAIKQIRVSIFQLQPPVPGSLRGAVLDVVAEVQPGLGCRPAARPRRAARLGGHTRPGQRRDGRRARGPGQRRPACRGVDGGPEHPRDHQPPDRHRQRRRCRSRRGRPSQWSRQPARPGREPQRLDGRRRGARPRRHHPGLDRPDHLSPPVVPAREARTLPAAG